MMLYLLTQSLPMHAGEYRVDKINSYEAVAEIRAANAFNKLRAMINFGSTAAVISSATLLPIGWVGRPEPPMLDDGDIVIEIRLRPNVGKGQKIALEDLEFYLIRYRSDYKVKQEAPSFWPAVC